MVNTHSSAGFRQLHFESIDDVLAEVDRIEQADADGTLNTNGNWKAGQILAHLAAWIDYAYDGFPMKPAPGVLRWILRLRLNKMLNGRMPRGVKIPGIKGGTTGADDLPVGAAAEKLRKALSRLRSDEVARHPSPAFGMLTHEQRVKLNLRHAELHMGYLEY